MVGSILRQMRSLFCYSKYGDPTILGSFVFSHYEQVYRTQKVCVSGPMFIRQVAISMHFRTYVYWTGRRKCAFPDLYLLDRSQKVCFSGTLFIGQVAESVHFRTLVYWTFFLVLVGTTTSQNIRHFLKCKRL